MPDIRFHQSLHFRITAIFLVLLAAFTVGYYHWMQKLIFGVEWAAGEQQWHEELQVAEFDSLARLLSPVREDPERAAELLDDYARRVENYGIEISVVDAEGRLRTTTGPEPEIRLLETISPALLDSMSRPDWDFDSFPISDDLTAYPNLIFGVSPIRAAADTTAPADGWLIGAFVIPDVPESELAADERNLQIWGTIAVLIYAALVGLIIMAWVSRRVRRLSIEMEAFRGGDFERRVDARAGDEIGVLGRDFNAMAERLSGLIAKLQESRDFQRQLVANVSHDLRTPLAGLRGYVETLELRGETMDPEERRRCMGRITKNLDGLAGLIERLFELSRLDTGQVEFRREAFPLPELAAAVLEQFGGEAERLNVSLACDAPEDLPLVWADPVWIRQVLQNLVANGLKFNRENGEIRISLEPVGEGIAVSVADTGVGISEEDLPHVFERFYTADKSRSGTWGGTGLGLAIAQSVVAGHGGELTVASSRDEGTVFRFTLPAAPAD